jgi:phosphoribosylformimino-5-aminoimidazole carboxamide ribotide isomerase
MQVIPVLDICGGVVVRGIAGRRQEYRPIVTPLVASADVVEVAHGFRDHFGLNELYVADLDAIAGAPPALPIYDELIRHGFRLLVDAGIRDLTDAESLVDRGVSGIVAGLETLGGPDVLAKLCQAHGSGRIVFSLDLREGKPLGMTRAWNSDGPRGIAGQAYHCGARRMIVLDLSRVGVSDGTGTEELCSALMTSFPALSIIAGGGVRGVEDLLRMKERGIAGALVASVLHEERLTREQIAIVMPAERGA